MSEIEGEPVPEMFPPLELPDLSALTDRLNALLADLPPELAALVPVFVVLRAMVIETVSALSGVTGRVNAIGMTVDRLHTLRALFEILADAPPDVISDMGQAVFNTFASIFWHIMKKVE